MAFAQYYKASKEEWAKELAIQIFETVEKRKTNSVGQWNKNIGETRSFKPFSIPMIDLNLCEEMKEAIPELDVEKRLQANLDMVFNTFLDPRGYFRENVSDDPEAFDTFEGRLVQATYNSLLCFVSLKITSVLCRLILATHQKRIGLFCTLA